MADNDFIDQIVLEFLRATNIVTDIFELFGGTARVKDGFSQILIYSYQVLMIDLLPGFNHLAANKCMISFGILARTMQDLTTQILWIDSLEGDERAEVIKTYLEFEGIAFVGNKKIYDWEKLVKNPVSAKQRALNLGIDQEAYYIGADFKVTVFDYLSKLAHLNPKMLKEIIGKSQNGKIGYLPEYSRMLTIAISLIIDCLTLYIGTFIGHFYNEDPKGLDANEKILDMHKRYHIWLNKKLGITEQAAN